MKLISALVLGAAAASPVLAQDTRQLEAHEHGVGHLDIAFDGQTIAMELHAPGADIVGFEYLAESSADRAAVDDGVAKLARPLDLFVLPAAAACSVVQASAMLASEDDHDADDHDDDHGDEDHEKGHEDDHEDDHEDENHAHDDDHADEAGHTEFRAEYLLTCANPEAVTTIAFAYFDAFANAQEVEVQVISESGAKAFEVERGAPVLDLRSMF